MTFNLLTADCGLGFCGTPGFTRGFVTLFAAPTAPPLPAESVLRCPGLPLFVLAEACSTTQLPVLAHVGLVLLTSLEQFTELPAALLTLLLPRTDDDDDDGSKTEEFRSMFLCPSPISKVCTIDGLIAAARCLIVPTFSLANGKVLESVEEDDVVDSKLVVDSLRLSRLAERTGVSVLFPLSCKAMLKGFVLQAGTSRPGEIRFI